MRQFLCVAIFLVCGVAQAQFVPNQSPMPIVSAPPVGPTMPPVESFREGWRETWTHEFRPLNREHDGWNNGWSNGGWYYNPNTLNYQRPVEPIYQQPIYQQPYCYPQQYYCYPRRTSWWGW